MNRRIYRSANGKVVDIDSLRIANEESIAIGNMKTNARGDELGPGGVILKKKSEIEAERNALPSTNPRRTTENAGASTAPKKVPTQQVEPDPVTQAKAQQYQPVEFPDDLEDEIPFTEEELAQANKPAMRGSLAASVAEKQTVQQKLQQDPRKPKGPQRI